NPRLARAFTNSVLSSNFINFGDRFLGRGMFSGDVTGEDRLRLEDRIDEYLVVHDPLIPHGVNGPGRDDGPDHASYHHTPFAQPGFHATVGSSATRMAPAVQLRSNFGRHNLPEFERTPGLVYPHRSGLY